MALLHHLLVIFHLYFAIPAKVILKQLIRKYRRQLKAWLEARSFQVGKSIVLIIRLWKFLMFLVSSLLDSNENILTMKDFPIYDMH